MNIFGMRQLEKMFQTADTHADVEIIWFTSGQIILK